ncbi:MAG: DUF4097 domain-containing protein [Ruminococcus sp.]|nr:DUF4097 domain-containing protein [Ruminococcus sp.]
MKKGWKVFWIVCIALAVLGSAFCISGALLGATMAGVREIFQDWPEQHGYYASGEYSGDASASGYTEETAEGAESGEAYAQEDGVQENRFMNVQKLEVDVTWLEVWIQQTEENQITVQSELDEEIRNDFFVQQDGEELQIGLKNRDKWEKTHLAAGGVKGTVTIGLPQDQKLQEISLKIGAGTLEADTLLAQELDVELGAGKVYVSDFTAEKMKLECGAGEADITGDAAREVEIECGVGIVTYYASGSQYDYNYKLECGIGTLDVGDNSYSGLGNEHQIDNGSSRKMEIECGIGQVEVAFDE